MEKVFGGDQDAIKQGILTPAKISIHELPRKTQETKL